MLTLIEGDCLTAMRDMGQRGERFHLVYADPPFFTQQVHRARGEIAFDDRWPSLEAFVDSVTTRLVAAWCLLDCSGSLIVHVDPKTSHYLKVRLDAEFGADHFASEIIWRYRRWPSKTQNFQRVHDVLLRYVREPHEPQRWTQLYEPLAASTLKTWGKRVQRAVVRDGRRVRSSVTEQESRGTPLGDVWEIGIIAPVAKERTGYPTQKPEALLERLILATTHEGDRVLDPMCGSGTTLAVADRLGRHAVGIDSSPVAIRYARERLGLTEGVAC